MSLPTQTVANTVHYWSSTARGKSAPEIFVTLVVRHDLRGAGVFGEEGEEFFPRVINKWEESFRRASSAPLDSVCSNRNRRASTAVPGMLAAPAPGTGGRAAILVSYRRTPTSGTPAPPHREGPRHPPRANPNKHSGRSADLGHCAANKLVVVNQIVSINDRMTGLDHRQRVLAAARLIDRKRGVRRSAAEIVRAFACFPFVRVGRHCKMPLAGMAHPAVFLCDHEIPIVSPRPPPVISDMHLFDGGYIAAEAVAGKPASSAKTPAGLGGCARSNRGLDRPPCRPA